MLSMLSEANIASWCSPLRSSPSYTASRRRFASEALAALRSKSRLYTPLAPKFLASRLLVDLCFTKLCSKRVQGVVELYLRSELAAFAGGDGFYPLLVSHQGGFARHSTGCLPPPWGGRIHLNSTESQAVAGIIRSHRQLREANRQSHHIRSTPSITQRAAPRPPC